MTSETMVKITLEKFENKLLLEVTQNCVKSTHKIDLPKSGVVDLGELLRGLEIDLERK